MMVRIRKYSNSGKKKLFSLRQSISLDNKNNRPQEAWLFVGCIGMKNSMTLIPQRIKRSHMISQSDVLKIARHFHSQSRATCFFFKQKIRYYIYMEDTAPKFVKVRALSNLKLNVQKCFRQVLLGTRNCPGLLRSMWYQKLYTWTLTR